MGNFKNIVLKNIIKAYKGRKIWIKLLKSYGLTDKHYVVLMPSLNRDYNYYALLYLDKFLEKENAEGALILTYDENVKKCARMFSGKIIDVADFSREKAELLMKFYCLYQFTYRLIIASLEEPEGRDGLNLVGKKGITIEEIIAVGLYGLNREDRAAPPEYKGNDPEILSFLNK